MNDTEQRTAAKAFAERWKGRGYEKGESQSFWIELLQSVYGIENATQFIIFEEQVHLDHTSFIDGMIPSTKVMIEQKGIGKDLNKPIKQSDGTLLTPFQQAKRYITELPLSQHPRWVVTCNFEKFQVYDMERPGGEPEVILLKNLPKEYYRLQFLTDTGNEHLKREMEVSIAAGEIVGLLYDAFAKQYTDPTSKHALHSLNVLCVRLVFCLYSEDAGIFGHYGMFHDYLASFETRKMRKALIELFQILDTPDEERDPYMVNDNPELAAFPYVNGGLFSDENIEIPSFTDEIRDLLLEKASNGFNWSEISPTIFGAVFESTLNPETRRSGGMHYTSVENIHKVIDPLFLDDLKKEFRDICAISAERTRERKLRDFQKKLATPCYLDPACGSGNFLTESYLALRRIENDVLRELSHGQITFGDANYNPIQVSLSQFYGIEINDFAVTVAKTALWIAESQMMKETEEIVLMHLDFLPLKSYTNIVEGNALLINWEDVVPKHKISIIMGNPPFVGKKEQSKSQKAELLSLFDDDAKRTGNLDYVSGWYMKAARFIQNSDIRVAFVSTNSITQGEQVSLLWSQLIDKYKVHIDFAYRTFKWSSEASIKAHVHCVIIGFSTALSLTQKKIYALDRMWYAENINPYLIDAPNILITSRNHPLCDVPEIVTGNQATDDGNFFISQDEYDDFISAAPYAEKYLHKAYNSQGFINSKVQYCLWLVGVSPAELRKMPLVMERVERVREYRLASPKLATRKQADIPTLFTEIRQPSGNYIVIPKVSSENRRYIPLGFLTPDVICNNTIKFVPEATLYHFGVLCSNVHNAWMRVVAGRLKSDYQYSNTIVYNSFPWPQSTEEQKARIEQCAQGILDARNLYPESSLADLYDDVAMPPELRRAHQNNDRAVMVAYGFTKDSPAFSSESACVAELMKLYQKMVAENG